MTELYADRKKRMNLVIAEGGWRRSINSNEDIAHVLAPLMTLHLYREAVATADATEAQRETLLSRVREEFMVELRDLRNELNEYDFTDIP